MTNCRVKFCLNICVEESQIIAVCPSVATVCKWFVYGCMVGWRVEHI